MRVAFAYINIFLLAVQRDFMRIAQTVAARGHQVQMFILGHGKGNARITLN